jgi:DNA transposition AAA+ family ATPase
MFLKINDDYIICNYLLIDNKFILKFNDESTHNIIKNISKIKFNLTTSNFKLYGCFIIADKFINDEFEVILNFDYFTFNSINVNRKFKIGNILC